MNIVDRLQRLSDVSNQIDETSETLRVLQKRRVDLIVECHENGDNMSEVIRRSKISRPSVYAALRKRGFQPRIPVIHYPPMRAVLPGQDLTRQRDINLDVKLRRG